MRSHNRARFTSPVQSTTTPNECPSGVTKLSNEVLLNIFRFYLDASPRYWPTLVHICRKWRRIVFACQQSLQLRLFCTNGTPVLKNLDCWPAALPIVVEYDGSPTLNHPTPEDEDNIISALKQSGRITSIRLTITNSLMEKSSTVEGWFPELVELVLTSQDSGWMPFTTASWWCPRLHTLHLTRVTLPGLTKFLTSSRNLVYLQLHEVLENWLFSPDVLTNALSGMAQLRSLSLHLLFTGHYTASPPPLRGRIVFPTLTHFDFQGTSEYLEDLVARIDASRLEDFGLTLFKQPMALQLCLFVDRISMHKSFSRADIQFFGRAISISFIQPAPTATCLKLRVSCRALDVQLFYVAQICRHSAFISYVEDLHISATLPSRQIDRFNDSGWPKLIDSFRDVKWLHVAGNSSVRIVHVLRPSEMHHETARTVLPVLRRLFVREHGHRYAPLREAVSSPMVSRWLSSSDFEVEYERPLVKEAETYSQHATIEVLCDDVLLDIFRHFLDVSPHLWPTLTHICQRWKHIVLCLPVGLHLRLYCTYGTPVLKTLDCWPPFPLVLNYGRSPMLEPPTPEDEDNIMAALKLSDRVSSISLTTTSPLLAKLSAVQEPFLELEQLVLLSQENVQLTLPGTFRWGPRLSILRTTRVAIPSLPRLLLPSRGLTELQLDEIPSPGYFSPEAFVNALSGMTQLRTLSLHFYSFPSRRNYLSLPPPPEERVVLPALVYLKYRGTSKYLDCLAARIDAPRLGDIDITFFNQPTMDASQLCQFIDRIEIHNIHRQADILTSERAVSISTSQPGAPTRLKLGISSEQLDWQLASLAQICTHFSPLILRVEGLAIGTTELSSLQGDIDSDGEQWVALIRSFSSAKDFRVAGELATCILSALAEPNANGEHSVWLPALRTLSLSGVEWTVTGPLGEAVESFIDSRRLSGSPIEVYPPHMRPRYSCTFCNRSFIQLQHLNRHMRDEHIPRNICQYCGVFEWPPGRRDLFQRHLERVHPRTVTPQPYKY